VFLIAGGVLRSQLLLLTAAVSLTAQTIMPIPPPVSVSSILQQAPIAPTNSVQAGDVVFPHFAFGNGWNTTLVIVNMSPVTVAFKQYFFDQSGNLLPVTFRTIPGGNLVTTSSAEGSLQPNTSFNILLFDPGVGSVTKIGWSVLLYDSVNTRLGGYAIFQQILSLGTYEALVPLSSESDYKFYLPFDNRAGFTTTMAIANPGNAATTVTFTFRDTSGNQLGTATGTIPPGNQKAFLLSDLAPQINGFAGAAYVTGSTTYLSALGFRFNLVSGAFATIPILNWPGMFP
jgi:hypothetical protein